ncbi:hypothetical protein D3C81_1138660 [compost metagenome]
MQTRGVVGVGNVTGVVDLERTGTGVGHRAIVAHGEETGTVDAHVQHVAGVVDVTLGELLGNVGQTHTIADHFAAAAQASRRVNVFEFCTGRFETGGRDVGDVVAGHVQLFVGCIETAKADIERHIPLLCAG